VAHHRTGAVVLVAVAATLAVSSPAVALTNGTPARAGEFSYIARIQDVVSGGFCTGSLIDRQWILTAGHCLTSDGKGTPGKALPASRYRVTVGAVAGTRQDVGGVKMIVPNGGETRNVVSVHPGNSGIGLLHLDRPITTIKPVALASPGQSFLWKGGSRIERAGWGFLNDKATVASLELRHGWQTVDKQWVGSSTELKTVEDMPGDVRGQGGDSGSPVLGYKDGPIVLAVFDGALTVAGLRWGDYSTLVGTTTVAQWIESTISYNSSVPTPRPVPVPPVPQNRSPVARINTTRLTGTGNPVRLDGTTSSDADGKVTAWDWFAGGTHIAAGATATVKLGAGASKELTLVVTDDKGAAASATTTLSLPNRAPRLSASPGDGATVPSTTPTLTASGSDDDGDVLTYSYRVTGPSADVSSGWVSGAWTVPAHRLDPGVTYTWTATVRDPAGKTASVQRRFTVAMLPTAADVVATPAGNGYWQVDTFGHVFSYGDARYHGGLEDVGVRVSNIIGMARTPSGAGYWLVGRDGGVFAFGDAAFKGSLPGLNIRVANIVGMAATRTGQGYWLVGSDGGVFAFGDAPFFGSMGGKPLNKPVNSIAVTASNGGYWLAADDGGIFAFGDAPFLGSMGGKPLNAPVTDMDATPDGRGYWMTAEDGGVFAFGNAAFHGSMAGRPLNGRITGMSATPNGGGYWLTGCDGGIFAFGNATFRGSNPTNRCRGS
jgi:hypothetical protein